MPSCKALRGFETEEAAATIAASMNVHVPSIAFGQVAFEPFLCGCGAWHVDRKDRDRG